MAERMTLIDKLIAPCDHLENSGPLGFCISAIIGAVFMVIGFPIMLMFGLISCFLPESPAQRRERERADQEYAEKEQQRKLEYERQEKERIERERLERERARAEQQRISRDLGELRQLHPREFENHVAKMFRRLGYTVRQTSYANDGGYDAIIEKGGYKCLLECKRYAEEQVIGRPTLQRFRSVVLDAKADYGIFVTTSQFSQPAIEYINCHDDVKIKLVDAHKLLDMMEKSYSNYDVDNDW